MGQVPTLWARFARVCRAERYSVLPEQHESPHRERFLCCRLVITPPRRRRPTGRCVARDITLGCRNNMRSLGGAPPAGIAGTTYLWNR